MITLYTFGPAFGLPDPSPFVMKSLIHLKEARLPFETDTKGFNKAPKGKLPYLKDTDGTVVADSSLIRSHLEKKHGVDFDTGLSPQEKAVALAFERLCEDHLYWALMAERWLDDRNFDAGPRGYFTIVPAPLRPLVIFKVRREVRRNLHGHGLGRHSPDEITRLAIADVEAISRFLDDKAFLMGPTPCGADATVASFVTGLLCPIFESPLRRFAEACPNLIGYRDRCLARWFNE